MTSKKTQKLNYTAGRNLPTNDENDGDDYFFIGYSKLSPKKKGIAKRILQGYKSGHISKEEADLYFTYHSIPCMHSDDVPY